jgi:hypothetical protein
MGASPEIAEASVGRQRSFRPQTNVFATDETVKQRSSLDYNSKATMMWPDAA